MRIFVDMDGVIVDWLGAAAKACGLDVRSPTIRNKLKQGVELQEAFGISDGAMWSRITPYGSEWWANLQPLPWANELLTRLAQRGDVTLLTSPGKLPDVAATAAAGKIKYIHQRLGGMPYIITWHKERCVAPDVILVDDSEKKYNKFIEAKGAAFLWPCQYRIIDGDITFDEVFDDLQKALYAIEVD